MDLQGLSHRIAELRDARGLSKAALARAAGMDRGVLIELEAGSRAKLYLSAVVDIARALQVRPSALLRGWTTLPGPVAGEPMNPAVFDRVVRDRLRSERKRLGFGAKTAASLSGVQQPWLVRVETGLFLRINLETLHAYCTGLEIDTLDDIIVPAEVSALEDRHGRHGSTEEDDSLVGTGPGKGGAAPR